MRRRRDPMANVVRRVWTERIDARAFAAIAEFSETWHGMRFAASTFLLRPLTSTPRSDQRDACREVERKLLDELRCGRFIGRANRRGMPMVGHVKDLNRS